MTINQLQRVLRRLDDERDGSCDLEQLADEVLASCHRAEIGHPSTADSPVSALYISRVLHTLYEYYALHHERLQELNAHNNSTGLDAR